jgi:YgiT-type zinc finger domain-containing protein
VKCVICKQGDTQPGQVHVTLQRGNTVVVIKNVPADVSANCQEYYLSPDATDRVLAPGEEAVRRGAEIEVVGFAA